MTFLIWVPFCRFLSQTDKRPSPISKIVVRPSFFFSYSGLQKKVSTWRFVFWIKNKIGNLTSLVFWKVCFGVLWVKWNYCFFPSPKVFDVMLLSDFCFLMFGLGWYQRHFVGLISSVPFWDSISRGQTKSFISDGLNFDFLSILSTLSQKVRICYRSACVHIPVEKERRQFLRYVHTDTFVFILSPLCYGGFVSASLYKAKFRERTHGA